MESGDLIGLAEQSPDVDNRQTKSSLKIGSGCGASFPHTGPQGIRFHLHEAQGLHTGPVAVSTRCDPAEHGNEGGRLSVVELWEIVATSECLHAARGRLAEHGDVREVNRLL